MIAIIPARGGSKGLPGKNIKLMAGKPLIYYTIDAAKKSEKIDRIIVSTDDIEIAKIAVSYGAEVPFMRPRELSSDTAKSIDVYKHILEQLEHSETIESFVVLQPTSPLRSGGDIDKAIKLFENMDADSVISYCQEHHPIRWHKYITDENRFEDIFGNIIDNRQTERPSYFPNGAIYVFRRDIVDTGLYYTNRSYAYIMDRKSSVDIDDIHDFEYAEFLLNKIKN